MCCQGFYGPPYGIPIEEETHNRYSPQLKSAWRVFDKWWQKVRQESSGDLIDRNSMPPDVKSAYDLIKSTPIPGIEDSTGADSCYMIGVDSMMTDS